MPISDSTSSTSAAAAKPVRTGMPRVAALMAATVAVATSCSEISSPGRDPAKDKAVVTYSATVSEGPRLPQGRGSHAGGVVDGRVVVAGGSAWSDDRKTKHWLGDSLVFDAATGAWSAGPQLSHAVAEMMFAGDGKALYIVGGKDGQTTHADAYRMSGRNGRLTVETLPRLPLALSGGAGAMLDGEFYVAGGYDNRGGMTDGLWALDVTQAGATWRACAAVPSPRRGYSALAACGGALYLLGGCIVKNDTNPTRQVFKDVHRYDPRADVWTRRPDLPTAGQAWVASAVGDHHLLLTGRGDTGIYDEVWIIDVRDSSVRGLGTLVIPSFGAPLLRVAPDLWWFIAGEPDANKSRTPRISVIQLQRGY